MGKIILRGECLINRVAELHELFLQHLNQDDPQLELDIQEVGRCDLSFFQLICSASRSFADKNKTLTLLGGLPETLVDRYMRTGMGPACMACPRDDCFLKQAADTRQQ